jgi:hypothetical protein
MTDIALRSSTGRVPVWLVAIALGGIAWNAFGAVQFAGSVAATTESLLASGLTDEQAAIMVAYPVWMTVAFGIGVAGGLVGSVLLLWRHRLSRPVFGVSMAAYAALWLGDAAYGVFAALGMAQMVILTAVVAIAAALFLVSGRSAART